MKQSVHSITRFRPTTLIAVLALFVAIGGTATAASGLINGGKIKPGTVTEKKLRNNTLTVAKFTPATVAALKGAEGPRGEKGEKGEKGETGAPGAPGPKVVNSISADNTVSNVPANDAVQVVALNNLPASKYLVIAKSIMFANSSGAMLRCYVETNNNGGGDEAQWNSTANATRTTVPMVLSTTAKVTQIKLSCDPGATVGSFTARVVAIPVG